MNSTTYLTGLFSSLAEKGRQFLGAPEDTRERRVDELETLCGDLLSGRGEASSVALAREAFDRYERLDESGKRQFFTRLAQAFGPDRDRLAAAVRRWEDDRGDGAGADLHYASEPRRVSLFRRLNRAPGGAAALVSMRADLLSMIGGDAMLEIVDRDLVRLLSSWFDRGFLVLRRIDWTSPALILEKLIRYEAVHEIRGWDDLRRRIDSEDRRCWAFFHPAIADEPLVFVEVALTARIPSEIEALLSGDAPVTALEHARVAVFYSISNCLSGLTGVSFGNFLIKQVVEELRRELPRLNAFVTLSPAPRFVGWLRDEKTAGRLTQDQADVVDRLGDPSWVDDASLASIVRTQLEPLAARYFLVARTSDGRVIDPVARFHLGNGARLEQIDWLGDRSRRALAQSAGLMVNYLYDLDRIETNHEKYANERVVATSSGVKKLLRAGRRSASKHQDGDQEQKADE